MKSREYKYLRRSKIKLRSISFVDGILKVKSPSYAYEFLSKHTRNKSYGYQFLLNRPVWKSEITKEAYDSPKLGTSIIDELPLWCQPTNRISIITQQLFGTSIY